MWIVTIDSDGTQTISTTVTSTTTNADGSTSSTTTTTSQTSSGGGSTSSTNASTGQTTGTTTNPTITNSTSGGTQTTDSDGNITGSTYTEPEMTTDDPTDPNCPSCVPGLDNYGNADYTAIDGSIDSYKTPYSDSLIAKPNKTINWNVGATCTDTNFTFMSYTATFAICEYIRVH